MCSSTLTCVEPSEEIRRVIDRLTTAIAEGDSESVLGRLSDHPGTLIVGSDPAEWWRGHETRSIWGRQMEEFDGSFLVTSGEIDAWEEGSVGWASVKETIDWGGKTIEGRASYILHLNTASGRSCTCTGHSRRPTSTSWADP
jgi:SnoaL-like protein